MASAHPTRMCARQVLKENRFAKGVNTRPRPFGFGRDQRVSVFVVAFAIVAIARSPIAVAIVVAVKAVGIASTLAATGLLGASGHEVEFFTRQLDRGSEVGHVLHVGLLSICDISGGMFAVTAATLSLAARHQSGCTAAKFFCAAPQGACVFNLVFHFFCFSFFFVFRFILMAVRKATIELRAVNIFIGSTPGLMSFSDKFGTKTKRGDDRICEAFYAAAPKVATSAT